MKQGLILWVFVFAGPVAWFLDLEANFAFSTQVCSGTWRFAPALISIVAVMIAASAGTSLWVRFRHMRQTQPPGSAVYHIVAIAGAMLSAAFAVVIVAESIPVILMQNCR